MSSFLLLKWGVKILYLTINQNQTHRSDSANLEPSEPIFCPPNTGAQSIAPKASATAQPIMEPTARESGVLGASAHTAENHANRSSRGMAANLRRCVANAAGVDMRKSRSRSS